MICGYGDSNRSPHGSLLEAERVLNKAIDAGVGKDSKAAEAGPVTPASGSSVSMECSSAAEGGSIRTSDRTSDAQMHESMIAASRASSRLLRHMQNRKHFMNEKNMVVVGETVSRSLGLARPGNHHDAKRDRQENSVAPARMQYKYLPLRRPLRRPPTQATVASPFRPPVVAPATGIGIPSSGRPRDRPPLRRPPAQATVASPFVRLSQPAPVGRWPLGAGHGAGRRSVGAGHGAGRQPLHRPNMCRSWSVQMLGERARVRDANSGLYHFRKDRKVGA